MRLCYPRYRGILLAHQYALFCHLPELVGTSRHSGSALYAELVNALLGADHTRRFPVVDNEAPGEGTSHAVEAGRAPLQIEDNAGEIIGSSSRSVPPTARVPKFVFFEDANGHLVRVATDDLGLAAVPQNLDVADVVPELPASNGFDGEILVSTTTISVAAAPIGRPWRDADATLAIEVPPANDTPPLVIEIDSSSDDEMDLSDV